MEWLIYSSLMVLALGVLTSITLLAGYHIFILVPCLYFLPKTNFKEWSKSTWAFVFMTLAIVLSILVNQDIAVHGYEPLSKTKYFFFGFLAIAPFSYYFENFYDEKKISYLLYALCISATVATLYGIMTHIPLILARDPEWRNGGFFGMIMNYAHNMTYFMIILIGLVIYRKETEKFISTKFLYIVLVINLFGFYLTYTRGAWLGLLVGVPFYFFKNYKKQFLMAIFAFALLGAGVYWSAGRSMYRQDKDESRMGQWQAAVYAFKERPLLGVGFLNFGPLSSPIKKKYGLLAPEFSGHAHNNFFEMLGATGGLGFIGYVLWIIFWFKEMLKRDDLVARIGLPFIVAFVVGGLTQSTISLGINLFFVFGVYALTQAKKDIV